MVTDHLADPEPPKSLPVVVTAAAGQLLTIDRGGAGARLQVSSVVYSD